MKADHLNKVQARADRVRQLLLPGTVTRGDIADPQDRLRELIQRLGNREILGKEFPLRTAVADVVRFLNVDVPELIQAVRDEKTAAAQAKRELAGRAGTQ